jgi:autophagy-related protein 16
MNIRGVGIRAIRDQIVQESLTGHTDKIMVVVSSSSDRVVSGSHDRTLKQWDLARGFSLRTVLLLVIP